MMTESLGVNTGKVVSFAVYSDGEKVADTFRFKSIMVHHEVNRIGSAILEIIADDVPNTDILENAADDFEPGRKITIELGHEQMNQTVFEGRVVAHKVNIPCHMDASPLLVVECENMAGNEVTIEHPDVSASPVLELTYGKDLLGFDGELYAEESAGEVHATFMKAGLSRYRGTLSFCGHAAAVPGCIIGLNGLGARFNGKVYAGSVTHIVKDGQWVTEVGMGFSPVNITKVITIATPGKNSIIFNDEDKSITLEDENKNKIILNKEGIRLESAKDIVLSAKGNITLDATGKTVIKAKQDLAVEGMNVNMKAQVGVKVSGSATAELSASGHTTVKGAIVMIN